MALNEAEHAHGERRVTGYLHDQIKDGVNRQVVAAKNEKR